MSDARLTFGAKLVWLVLAPIAIGAATGASVAGLLGVVEWAGNERLEKLPGIVPALFAPLAFVLTCLVARFVARAEKPSTSELYVTVYHEPESRVPIEQVPGRVLAAATTVTLGGSQGFESTSALIGASFGEALARIRRFAPPVQVRKSLLAAGGSSGIAAVFSSPGCGTLYGIEIPYKNDVDVPRLVPCVLAAVASFAMRTWLIGSQRIVDVVDRPRFDGWFLVGCLLVALGCGLGARLFATIQERMHRIAERQSWMTRALIAGCLLTLAAIAGHEVCGRWITFGSGYIATGWLQGETRGAALIGLAFLIRASGNLITVYGGGGGGVFTSLACNGAFVGEFVAQLLGCDQSHTLALFGAACFLGAGYRLPLACMLFLAEAGVGVAPTAAGLTAVAVAMIAMGNESVSDAQIERRAS